MIKKMKQNENVNQKKKKKKEKNVEWTACFCLMTILWTQTELSNLD